MNTLYRIVNRRLGVGAVRRHPHCKPLAEMRDAPLVPGWLVIIAAVCFAVMVLR